MFANGSDGSNGDIYYIYVESKDTTSKVGPEHTSEPAKGPGMTAGPQEAKRRRAKLTTAPS